MKLEKQVCTLEQAKKLKELGVDANSFATWVYDTLNDRWDLSGLNIEAHALINKQREAYSAFTVGELGVMLPAYIQDAKDEYCLHSSKGRDKSYECGYISINVPLSTEFKKIFVRDTESEARAAMLIYLLVNNLSTSEEVNQRLKNS